MYTFLLLGIESSLREKWRLLKSKLEEKNKGSDKGKPHVRLSQSPFPASAGQRLKSLALRTSLAPSALTQSACGKFVVLQYLLLLLSGLFVFQQGSKYWREYQKRI